MNRVALSGACGLGGGRDNDSTRDRNAAEQSVRRRPSRQHHLGLKTIKTRLKAGTKMILQMGSGDSCAGNVLGKRVR